MTAARSTAGALWFLAGALIAALAMRLGPVREVHIDERIVVHASTPADESSGGVLVGPGLGP
jgi:hypothetical protein